MDLAIRVIDVIEQSYGRPESVADLFAGTGAFLEAAFRRNFSSISVDSNPISEVTLNVRVAVLQGDRPDFPRLRDAILAAPRRRLWTFPYEYTAKWIHPTNLLELRRILKSISVEPMDDISRQVGYLAVLSSVRSIAEVNQACTHHLVRLRRGEVAVRDHILRRLTAVEAVFKSLEFPLQRGSAQHRFKVLDSAATGERPGSHDVVVLHPPYLGVVNYYNVHRLALELFLDVVRPIGIESQSIKLADVSSDSEDAYHGKVNRVLDEAVRISRADGTIVLIQGDHRYRGRLRHPLTAQTVYLESLGWLLHERFIWQLEHNAGMHVQRKGHHIDHNYVSMFRRA